MHAVARAARQALETDTAALAAVPGIGRRVDAEAEAGRETGIATLRLGLRTAAFDDRYERQGRQQNVELDHGDPPVLGWKKGLGLSKNTFTIGFSGAEK